MIGFLNGIVYSFGIEAVIILLLNIYITFCPKSIESTFTTFYFSIIAFSVEMSTVFADVIINIFDINQEQNFKNIDYLIGSNIFFCCIAFIFIYLIQIPKKTVLNRKDSMLMDVKKEKLYYQENTIGSINYELNS